MVNPAEALFGRENKLCEGLSAITCLFVELLEDLDDSREIQRDVILKHEQIEVERHKRPLASGSLVRRYAGKHLRDSPCASGGERTGTVWQR